MSTPARILASVSLAALTWSVGRWTAPQAETHRIEVVNRVPTESWREQLDEARETAGAGSLRAEALDVLNVSESEPELRDAILLLGWMGHPEDAELIGSFAHARDPILAVPAVQALGRLGGEQATRTLITLTDDWRLGREAIGALGVTEHPEAWRALVAMLDQPQREVPAAHALARVGTEAAARRVIDALRRSDPTTASGIAAALTRFPRSLPMARDAVLRCATQGTDQHRHACLSALSTSRDPVVLDLLLNDLAVGTVTRQSQAATLLGQLGDPRAIGPLHQAALTASIAPQRAATRALGQIDTARARRSLLELVDVGPEDVAVQATLAVSDVRNPTTAALLLDSWPRRSWLVREAIGGRLYGAPWSEHPEAVLELARTELADAGPKGGGDALRFLLRWGDGEDQATVERVLLEGPVSTRVSAVNSLAQVPAGLSDPLLLALVNDVDGQVRTAAIQVLLQRGGQEWALERHLLTQLDAPQISYGEVERALMSLGTATARQAVANQLRNGTISETHRAMVALAEDNSATSQQLLAKAIQDASPAAKHALYKAALWQGRVNPNLVHQALAESDPAIQSLAIPLLAQQGAEGRETLLRLADTRTSGQQKAALRALASSGGPRGEARILEALDDPRLAPTALAALHQLGTPSSQQALVEVAIHGEPLLRADALRTLSWVPAPDAHQTLVDAAWDPDPLVHSAAIDALTSAGSFRAAEALLPLVDHEDSNIAASAAGALLKVGGPLAEQNRTNLEEVQAAFQSRWDEEADFQWPNAPWQMSELR